MPASLSPLERLRRSSHPALAAAGGAGPRVWFALVLFYALACAGLALHQAFASPYMFADDAREHVFWMARFISPALFPNDPIADYFQSLAPSGYAALYWLLAKIGIAPLLSSKVIPSALSLLAASYFFGLAHRFFRSPAAAALAAMLFIQALWSNSDLASATPRAFFYPLFCAFLYYQVRGSTIGVLGAILLEALFFPPAALLSLGVLGWDCLRWENRPRLTKRAISLFAAAFVLILLCVWPYLHRVGTFGPLVTYAQARQMPEFGPHGRVPFFLGSWWSYWVGGNAGTHSLPMRPPWFLAAFLWPLLRCFPKRFPLLQAIPRGARPIPQIIAAALSLFALAHLLLFHLYLPNRYTEAVTRVVMILLAGGVFSALFDAVLSWAERRLGQRLRPSTVAGLSLSAVLLTLILTYPLLLPRFPTASYIKGSDPGLYRFFARQPAAIQIASLANEANNLPLLTQRSIIIGAECAVPFHPGYYFPLRDRGLQIARAQYSADPAVLRQCLRDQKIDFWLLDRSAFSPGYWQQSRLLRELRLSVGDPTLGQSRGAMPVLERAAPRSIAYEDARFLVLDARRLLSAIGRREPGK